MTPVITDGVHIQISNISNDILQKSKMAKYYIPFSVSFISVHALIKFYEYGQMMK